jgi:hypothetical protein
MNKHVLVLVVLSAVGCGSVTLMDDAGQASQAGSTGATGSAGSPQAGSGGTGLADAGAAGQGPAAGGTGSLDGGLAGAAGGLGTQQDAGVDADSNVSEVGAAGKSGTAGATGAAGMGGTGGASGAGGTGGAGGAGGTGGVPLPPTGRATGTTCTIDQQCGSAFCRQGVCCMTACADPPAGGLASHTCMSCNVPGSIGTCSNVPAGGAAPPMQCFGEYPATCGQDVGG